VKVQVVGFTDGAWTGVDVIDDGPGISPANLPKVFDRFFTTDRAKGGTGLGLALVRAVMEAHGGRVEVESVLGRTRLRVVLPRL
jgi:signal transduction histidine kinase